ncbi:site-specific integrase [Streptomyces sp. NBC_00513]|uniref:tyrosine-type recombinase/integrase n=1 Tax=unclassified Streptomyces TaxID=2593676 RepID=UPI002252314F|nr:site-specific integrase [Streptomyces sp. NBC_00424]MCX5074301.1 site-specific integrase [Streptomyces sp. NBC_00424]WUD42506.1 site-specific integrase [Streptomyces sp. NBC_00513]
MAEKSKKGTRRANGETAIYFGKDGRWHARVPMGYRDNGEPYRRHITRLTEDLLMEEVKRLEKQRDQGTAQQPGKLWTVEKWLWHWVENIAKESVSENTYDGYEVAVRVHLVPGIGRHRIDRLEPEHLESLYRLMKSKGSKPATAHQAHRTARTALGEAVRRGHAAKNAAALAKPPRVEEAEDEIEPYSVEEIQSLLIEVNKRRNSARWMLALALGLRQGETLGLRWADVDLENEYLKLRRNRLRPKYAHGCKEADPCGRKAGYCPLRSQVRRETKNTKSRAGRRAVPLPGPLVRMLRAHKEVQARERKAAGDLWTESEYVFTKPLGGPLSPNTDYHDWKKLIGDAGVRDARLHDARHTAATVLMLLGVPDRVIDQIMGWEAGTSSRMRARYLHVPDAMLKDVAQKIGEAIWGPSQKVLVDKDQDNET